MTTQLETDTNGLTHGRGSVFSLKYHIVWCTKYRKPVLIDNIADDCKLFLSRVADEYGFIIDAIEVMPEHVHLLVTCTPYLSLSNLLRVSKGNTARWLFIKHPELKNALYGGHLWNPSYCVVTVSERSEAQVKHYIETQDME